MANVCTTQIRFHSNPKTIDWLESQIKEISKIEFPDEMNLEFINKFGKDGETIFEKIGSKWLIFYPDLVERSDFEEYSELFVQLETAWDPPKTLLINMNKILEEKDSEIYSDNNDYLFSTTTWGRYWDEFFKPIGVFEVYEDKILTDEQILDIDEDEEDYWDLYVEPAFDKLDV